MQRVQQIWITGVSEFGSSSGCLMKKDPKYPVTPTMSHIFSVLVHNPWKTRLKPLIMYLNHKCVLHFDHRQYSYVPRVVTGASDVNLFDFFFFQLLTNNRGHSGPRKTDYIETAKKWPFGHNATAAKLHSESHYFWWLALHCTSFLLTAPQLCVQSSKFKTGQPG